MEARLSQKEKELVAVGASVAAGCIPCTQYHLKEVRIAGATTEEITQAIDAALCVKSSTRGIMEKVAYDALGVPKEEQPSCCAGPTDRMKELVSIAAAVAVNCPTNFHKHVTTGRTVGVRDDEIQLVVGLAKMIRGKAMEKIDDAVKDLSAPAQAAACCGPTVSVKSAPQPQAASSCCGPSVSVQPGAAQPVQAAAKGACC
ncbi:MAG: carboxymuconolactone decarboxylase family protein [candidate division KSB1 bacterium]|nr:carboxymuconolactone decarboxylase family protein [candidate division KSB1 bacterium]